MKWFIKCIRHYFDFKGRASRREFWMFILVTAILGIASIFADTLMMRYCPPIVVTIARRSFMLFFFIPSFSVAARRLHDIGKSGYWSLLIFLPVIGTIIMLVWVARPGIDTENEYGQKPLQL